ncbi:MAG: hemerythrin domain-containing protein [Pseudomonadota bacterium]
MTQPSELSLHTRAGLPPALRALVEEFPRDGWERHVHFNGMVQFWMERHMMFRRLVDIMQADLQALEDQNMAFETYAPRLSRLGSTLLNELHGHHHIEDTHYFPELIRLDTGIERAFDLLESDHQAMDELLHGMAEGANAVLNGGGSAVAFQERLTHFSSLLDRHLTDEEEIVVPVVLKTGFAG